MAATAAKLTFAEHIYELRKRLMWSLLFIAIGAFIGYLLNDTIVELLQKPLNERLYYTTPTGAFSFILKVICVFGFIIALPVVMYQIFGFFEPLIKAKTRRLLVWYVFVSVVLAGAGILFAYFVSLPAALHFLVNFGNDTGDIKALITAEEYFNFVLAYIAGFAALFQVPLIIIFINKVKPLKPKQLLGFTRYVILFSFVAAAIITPTPDPINQALMAGPIILLYFMSVVIVAAINASKRKKYKNASVPDIVMAGIEDLLKEDTSLAPLMQPEPVSALNNKTSVKKKPSHSYVKPDRIHKPSTAAITDIRKPQPSSTKSSHRTVLEKRNFHNNASQPIARRSSVPPKRIVDVGARPIKREGAPIRLINDFIPAP